MTGTHMLFYLYSMTCYGNQSERQKVCLSSGSEGCGSILPQMHGTGTPLGDPIEIGAAVSAYLTADRQDPLTLASSKSAVGHAEPAAGELGVGT